MQAKILAFGESFVGTAQVPWDSGWISAGASAFNYKHGLCKAACLLSAAAYFPAENSGGYDSLERILSEFGFASVERHYDLDYSDEDFGHDQTAFSFASMKISGGTAVAVVVRGTPLSSEEWISNLNINDSWIDHPDHEGFSRATEQVFSALNSYLESNKINRKNARFLVTGHSRGAAVANLLCVRLHDEWGVRGESIFGYTFAAPNVTQRDDALDPKYKFIWNIVNPEDLVPTIPFGTEGWNFKKYGNSLVMTSYLTCKDPKVFAGEYLPRVNRIFSAMTGRDYSPFYAANFYPYIFYVSGSFFKPDLRSFYKEDGSPNEGMRNLVRKILPSSERSTGLIGDIVSEHEFAAKILFSLIPLESFVDMHRPETYLAWLSALEPDALFDCSGFSVLRLTGRPTMFVTDGEGRLLAHSQNGIPYNIEDKSIIPLPVLRLPSGTTYLAVPSNQVVTLNLTDDCVVATGTSVELLKFQPDGKFVESRDFGSFYVNWTRLYSSEIRGGQMSAPRLTTGVPAIRASWGHTDHSLKFRPGIFFDTKKNFGLALNAGNDYFYALGEFKTRKEHLTFGAGGGAQTNVTGAFYAGIQGSWQFEYDSDDKIWRNLPFAGITLDYKPRKRSRLSTAFGFQMDLDDDERDFQPVMRFGLWF